MEGEAGRGKEKRIKSRKIVTPLKIHVAVVVDGTVSEATRKI